MLAVGRELLLLLLCAAGSRLLVQRDGVACGGCRTCRLFDGAAAFLEGAAAFADEHGGGEAKHGDYGRENPGTFFHDIVCLANAHNLVTETTERTGKTAAFRILHQHEKAE